MATSGNVPNASTLGGGTPFERGLSIEDAERLAAAFKPSWELDDAPFAAGAPMDAAELELLSAGGVNSDVQRNLESRADSVPPHSPPRAATSIEP